MNFSRVSRISRCVGRVSEVKRRYRLVIDSPSMKSLTQKRPRGSMWWMRGTATPSERKNSVVIDSSSSRSRQIGCCLATLTQRLPVAPSSPVPNALSG